MPDRHRGICHRVDGESTLQKLPYLRHDAKLHVSYMMSDLLLTSNLLMNQTSGFDEHGSISRTLCLESRCFRHHSKWPRNWMEGLP